MGEYARRSRAISKTRNTGTPEHRNTGVFPSVMTHIRRGTASTFERYARRTPGTLTPRDTLLLLTILKS